MLIYPSPIAWNNAPMTIVKAARGKEYEILRSAISPISSILGDASKRLRRTSGIRMKAIIPSSIIINATVIPSLRAFIIRSLFFAP